MRRRPLWLRRPRPRPLLLFPHPPPLLLLSLTALHSTATASLPSTPLAPYHPSASMESTVPPPSASETETCNPPSLTSFHSSTSSASTASLSSLLTVCVDGRCSRRLSWEEVVTLVRANRLEALGRLDFQLREYSVAKAAMQREYHSVVDRLRERRLGAPCRAIEGRKKCDWGMEAAGGEGVATAATRPPLVRPYEEVTSDDGEVLRVCWYPNEFGYAIEGDVEHHLLWTDRLLETDSRLFQRLLRRHRPEAEWEAVVFINPPELRSIPDLHHIHIFSKRKPAPVP